MQHWPRPDLHGRESGRNEAKLGDDELDRSLPLLAARFPGCAAWQVHLTGKKDYQTPAGIRVAPALALLRTLV